MPKYRFLADVYRADESWRTIRSLRADPTPELRRTLADEERMAVFQTSLEQAQQQFAAAASIGYESRPLNLFYGLSQAGRAIAAASNRLGQNTSDEQTKEWKASGHGITFGTEIERSGGFYTTPVELKASKKDLFSRVSHALNSPLDLEKVEMKALLSQIPEIWLEFRGLADEIYLPVLFDVIGVTRESLLRLPVKWGIPLPMENKPNRRAEAQHLVDRYPALRGSEVVTDEDGLVEWQGDQLYVLTASANLFDAGPPHPYFLPLQGSVTYRRSRLTFPTVGVSDDHLHPLLSWWLALFGLSMLARYAPNEWTEVLSISTSPVASVVEHLLDSAIDAVPELLSEVFRGLNPAE